MLTVLEMALRELLARAGAPAPGVGRLGRRAARRCGTACARSTRELAGERLRGALARLVVAEEQVYRAGRADLLLRRLARGRRADRHHGAQPDVLHARRSASGTTRRPPSRGRSSSPPRRRPRRPGRGCSGASRRRSSGRRRTCARSSTRRPRRSRARSCSEIGRRELMRFRIGLDGLAHRPARAGDGVTAVVAERGPPAAGGRAAPSPRELRAGAGGGGATAP